MAYIVPNGQLWLCSNTRLTPNSQDTFYSANAASQFSAIANFAVLTRTGISYQRGQNNGRNWIRVEIAPSEMASAFACDYMIFRNQSYENKYFYAFIVGCEYINDNVLEFTFEIDNVQTWYHDVDIQKCMILRYHTPTDEIGENIQPETIDFGDGYVMDSLYNMVDLFSISAWDNCAILVRAFEQSEGTTYIGRVNGIFTGARYWAFNLSSSSGLSTYATEIKRLIDEGLTDEIVDIFVMPSPFVVSGGSVSADTPPSVSQISYTSSASPSLPTSFGSYTPKNNKLFTYPYTFLYAYYPGGQSLTLKFEDFTSSPKFGLYGMCAGSPQFALYPRTHRGFTNDYDNALIVNDFIHIACTSDTYKAYIAQNTGSITMGWVNVGLSAVGGTVNTVARAATAEIPSKVAGAVESAVNTATSLVAGIGTQIANIVDAMAKPNATRGTGSGSAFANLLASQPYVSVLKIKADYAEKVDNYFTMYGYAYNKIEKPSFYNRKNWTFVQTDDAKVYGNAPANARRDFENRLNNGLRFWQSLSSMGNYSLDNTPN